MKRFLVAFGITVGTLSMGSPQTSELQPNELKLFGVSEANAQRARQSVRRTARRTSRRTAARVNYRSSVAGCPFRAPYYYCGGVYYQAVVQSGTTVYIVVNP